MSEIGSEIKIKKSVQSLIILAQLNSVVLDGQKIDHRVILEGWEATWNQLLRIGKHGNLRMKGVQVKPETLYIQTVP